METVIDFILGLQNHCVDCSHRIKRCLLLGRRAVTNLDSVLKSRDITLLTKVHIFKAVVFPVVMYRNESWTVKKAECWRIDAFELVVLEKALESPLDSKKIQPVNPKGNQPWIFIGRTDALAEAPILWLPDAKRQPNGKDPDTGKTEGRRRRRQQGMRQLDSIANSMCMNLSKLQEIVVERWAWSAAAMGLQRLWGDLATKQQQ